MRNTKIKQFNENIVGYINHELSQGLDISAVVLCLEKCIADAKLVQRDVIENEQREAEMRAREQMAQMAAEEPVMDEPKKEAVCNCEACTDENCCEAHKE